MCCCLQTSSAESDPAINAWSDALFYSAIDTLYDAAAANAVYSVGEAYLQTAVRLATYLTPVVGVFLSVEGTTGTQDHSLNEVFVQCRKAHTCHLSFFTGLVGICK